MREVRQEVKANRNVSQKKLEIMSSSDATHAAVDKLDDDFVPCPFDSTEGFNALEESWVTIAVSNNWYVIFLSMLRTVFTRL